jgi:hypothetical protein
MKRTLLSLLGALVSGALCIGLSWGIGALWGPLYQGEDESTRNFKIFLVIFLASVFTGALVGFIAGRRSTSKSMQPNADASTD